MQVCKAASVVSAGVPDETQLAEINRLAKSALQAEDVYVFSVRLCDNQPDRDDERFSDDAIRALAPMFVGKTGVLDHTWSAEKQLGRIFRTEVMEEGALLWLKAWVYMLRGEKTESLIREIEGGIKKEVSVGCAVSRRVCSVCGQSAAVGCEHIPGREYEGKLCWVDLLEATDAYEFSFVAVPAQPKAGVMRKSGKGGKRMQQLEKEAELGRKYLKGLREEVVRLGGLAEPDLKMATLRAMADSLEESELLELKAVYTKRAGPAQAQGQLKRSEKSSQTEGRDSAFLI